MAYLALPLYRAGPRPVSDNQPDREARRPLPHATGNDPLAQLVADSFCLRTSLPWGREVAVLQGRPAAKACELCRVATASYGAIEAGLRGATASVGSVVRIAACSSQPKLGDFDVRQRT